MKYTTLPYSDLRVSKICLGTMTWGNQNTESEAHKQLDFALDKGINFIDTAELYPVPANAETQGRTSKIIGKWVQKSGKRNQIILASKIAGPGEYTSHIRTTGFSNQAIKEAVDAELKRLHTDYIDLFQLHWPERSTNVFGVRDYKHNPTEQWTYNFKAVLESLNAIIKAGKIRYIGISNEKAWGTMKYLEEASHHGLPRINTIQNPYSLINRTFEGELAEITLRENIGMLAYSPLAFGVLTGKYISGTARPEARLNLFPHFSRYSSSEAIAATIQYIELAKRLNFSPTKMALAFVNQQTFISSIIIGATTIKQLEENIGSINEKLSDDDIKKINTIHEAIPNPGP